MKTHFVAPSILSADFGNLERDIRMINESEADWIHCDIMDGIFVPNITFGFQVLRTVKKIAKKPLDVHLMIERPERFISEFRAAGADILTVHVEACVHLERTMTQIREAGMMAGVAINPGTPVSSISEVIEIADLVLVMSVNPGFGGQKFIQTAYRKIQEVKELARTSGTDTLVEVDGGVDSTKAMKLIQAGADVLVAGNSVFSSPDPKAIISVLKKAKADVRSV